jgi:DNA-binding transcriptional MocR family regulator
MSEAHNENVVGGPLKAAFLRGETVVAGHLAAALGVSRQGVTDALKRLSKRGLIKGQRVRPTGRGGSQVAWTCIDPAGMAAYVPKAACATAKPRPKEITEVAPLMEVWGMRVVDIPLPTFRHEIWARDEVTA